MWRSRHGGCALSGLRRAPGRLCGGFRAPLRAELRSAAAAAAIACAAGVICAGAGAAQGIAARSEAARSAAAEHAVVSSSASAAPQLAATVLPHPSASVTSVAGLSCLSARLCFAVGTATIIHGRSALTSNTGLIWRYDGSSWRLLDRLRIPQSSLAGISCSSASFCLAVGRAGNPESVTLALRWNGHTWSRASAASPASSGNGDALASVACPSRGSCFAVGGINLGEASAGLPNVLLEHWGGRRLSVVKAPDAGLLSIACAGSRDCWATTYPPGAQVETNEIEHFNGHSWSTVKLPVSMSGGEPGISCRTSAACWIVGDRNVNGLIPVAVHLVHGAWRSTPMQIPRYPDVTLQGIDCASSTDCFAVGANEIVGPGITNPSSQEPFAEQWNGSVWQRVNVVGAGSAYLAAVSCTSDGFCVAGGSQQRGAKSVPIAAVAR